MLHEQNSAWPRGDQDGTTNAMVPFFSGDFTLMEVSMPLYNQWGVEGKRVCEGEAQGALPLRCREV